MQKEVFLLKEGEIILKGLNRSNFEKSLAKNIKTALKDSKFKLQINQSVILIQPDSKEDVQQIEQKLDKIFGIVRFCKAISCEKNIETIVKTIVCYFYNKLKNCKTFRIQTKRGDKTFKFNSQQINEQIGSKLTSEFQNLKVDLSNNSELTIFVEIRNFNAYVYCENLNGAGGIPINKNNEAILLISGGIDSPVAGWLMAKRGIKLHAVHFFSPPYTSQRALNKVETLLQILTKWTGPIPFFCVNFTEIQQTIKNKCNEALTTILTRRFMNKIAQLIAKYQNSTNSKHIKALINGESLGQVASQTLDAIVCTQQATTLPILQPLIGLDKIEIIELAKKIGTFETSILPYEDCCTAFVPNHPKTKPNLHEILQNEQKIENLGNILKQAAKTAQFKIICT